MANYIQHIYDAGKLRSCKSPDDVATLLRAPLHRLALFCAHPRYHIYNIRKANGGMRHIEDPVEPIKTTLKKLNGYLQACYYAHRPTAVHGFCITVGDEEERNIVSNAGCHIGKKWLLNIDFKDFFHTVLAEQVHTIWSTYFKRFNKHLALMLTQLTCYNHRLPMGSPTSPVLSNYACLQMDAEMENFCKGAGIVYTRFADDCSFSSNTAIDAATIKMIRNVITANHFLINENKVKLYRPNEEKMVTGIVVGNHAISLPKHYLPQIHKEIERLRQTLAVDSRFNTGMSLKKLKLFEQELRCKINYAQMVLGSCEITDALQSAFEEALHPVEAFESSDWLDIPYTFFEP